MQSTSRLEDRLTEELENEGIVVVPRFVEDREQLVASREAILEALEDGSLREVPEEMGYSERGETEEPLLDVRGGADEGMETIFNVDHIDGVSLDLGIDAIEALVQAAHGAPIDHTQTCAYVNRGVTGTRGYHSDSLFSSNYKAFLYLTDVESKRDGPYCYIRKSNRFAPQFAPFIKKWNRVMGNLDTNAPVVPEVLEEVCLADKGTLIVSDQRGFHRGWPQAPDGERVLLMFQFAPSES